MEANKPPVNHYSLFKVLVLTLLVLNNYCAFAQGAKSGYGRAKFSIFFKRYFDFTNNGNTSKYKVSEKDANRLTFPAETDGYRLIFADNFDSFNASVWQKGQPWGEIHFQHPHQHYSDTNVFVENGVLHLLNTFAPKSFTIQDSTIVSPYAVGLVNTFRSVNFKYGYIAIRSKNPQGGATWPAFWLTGRHTWPPEIDIFEMYGTCKKGTIHRQTMSLHYGKLELNNKGSITKSVKLEPTTDSLFHIYACLWEPKKISFYTDGVKVASIRLNKWLQQEFNSSMYLIINNAVDERYLNCCPLTQKSQALMVDWVRIYGKDSAFVQNNV